LQLERVRCGEPTQFAVRLAADDPATGAPAGKAIGGAGYHELVIGRSHRAELGYWLAKPFWNRGIGSDIVRTLTDYGFEHFGLAKLSAHVYAWNTGSCRVLEKNGYQLEGILGRHYLKDGAFHDAKLYARLRDESAPGEQFSR
jgi:RimJ/RimL family protein N-acetyltransferase